MDSFINEEGYDEDDRVLDDVKRHYNPHHVIELKVLNKGIGIGAETKDSLIRHVHDLHVERQNGVDIH